MLTLSAIETSYGASQVLFGVSLTVAAGDNVVRLLPPLIIGEAEVDAAMEMLEKVAQSWFH